MKRKIFTLLLAAVAFSWVSAQDSRLTINVASKPSVDDGVIDSKDPWVAGDWVDVAKGKDNNVGDMSAKFQLRYDADNLYFGAVVQDADRFTGFGTTYLNDCIEFFISMDTTTYENNSGNYHTDLSTKQLRLQAVADPEATGGLIDCGQGAPASGTYVCFDNGTDYVQEWTMPWAELTEGMDPEWDQKQFRFDIQVANATADGQRTQQMFWDNTSDDQWRYTYRMGVVTLATPLTELGGVNTAAKMTINPTTKTVVADGVIDSKDAWLADKWVDVAVGKDANVGDMSAKFQLTYDKKNLYFGAVVQDADRFTGFGTTYLNDCIEFFISMDTTTYENNGGNYHTDLSTKQLRLQAVADTEATGGLIDCGQGAPASGQYVCVDNGTDYVQEWIMPWAELTEGMDPAWDEMQFRFDLQVANATADGVRSQQMFWDNNSDDQWRYTWRMAVVALSKKVSSLPDVTIGVKNVKVASDIYVDQNKQLQKVSGLVNVYDITGKLVIKQYATTGSISVAALKQGIYIVQSNNSSTKIAIQ